MVLKAVLLGVLTCTSYRPIPAQTKPSCHDKEHCFTAIGDVPTKFGIAVSQDLLAFNGGSLYYGDVLYITGYGFRVVNDTMHSRSKQAVDLMVWTKAEEHAVGVQHLKVWVVRKDQ